MLLVVSSEIPLQLTYSSWITTMSVSSFPGESRRLMDAALRAGANMKDIHPPDFSPEVRVPHIAPVRVIA